MFAAMETGKIDEFIAYGGQYFGTDKATDYQSTQALVGAQVMEELNKMAGAAQVEERKYIETLQAGFGKSPEANRRILEYMTEKNSSAIDRFNTADAYYQEHKSLSGYRPTFTSRIYGKGEEQQAPDQAQPEQTKEINGVQYINKNGKWYQL
jgi:hypothetical protein